MARQCRRYRRTPKYYGGARTGAQPYITPELSFRFHYFAMRKIDLAMRANALAVFPGGFGTLDEMFELLTLQQTQKAPPAPIVLFGESYWRWSSTSRLLWRRG